MISVRTFRTASVLAVLASSAATIVVACHSDTKTADLPACSEGQALQSDQMRGNGLPPKTIALTFDDGPGARTLELSHYLKSMNVRVGFFMMGKNIPQGQDGVALMQAIVDDGHVIGNHTWDHPDLTTLDASAVVDELTTTDKIIAPFVPNSRFMFRPPYGDWNDNVLAALQASPMSKYVGPVNWDLGYQWGPGMAADWDCWSPTGNSVPPVVDVVTCGNLYLQQIEAVGSGVVLMHDPYFINNDPDAAAGGGTVDMVKNILPVLQAEGFNFVRIDEVPSLAAQLPPLTVDAGPDATSASSTDASLAIATSTTGAAQATSASSDQPASTAGGGSSDPCSTSPQTNTANR